MRKRGFDNPLFLNTHSVYLSVVSVAFYSVEIRGNFPFPSANFPFSLIFFHISFADSKIIPIFAIANNSEYITPSDMG